MTDARSLRRGLPRTPGGDPWPPAGAGAGVVAPQGPIAATHDLAGAGAVGDAAADGAALPLDGHPPRTQVVAPHAAAAAGDPEDIGVRVVRRGLPRAAGGEPWPPSSAVGATDVAPAASGARVRRGLPRVAAGEPWPPADTVSVPRTRGAAAGAAGAAPDETCAPVQPTADATEPVEPAAVEPVGAASAPASAGSLELVAVVVAPSVPRVPLPFEPTVVAGRYAFARPATRPEPKRYGPFTRGQWAGAVVVAGAGMLFAAAMVVLAVRWLLSLDALQDFLAAYPGEYHLPETAPVGIPAWIGWQHFFNVFLMVLIIRSGLQVRREKRPGAFWTPRWNRKRKMSLALWFHQSLDILWLVNGVVFVVLLFVTGQWMRIVPTSWEVFPNALSAALQYASLDWPTENGWVNYNGLQQLAYFTTVFVAAPLATITGVRMSGIWPKKATTLNRIYPIEWARAVHFPVMIYFVVFIIVHVALVFATGALRNLNHMYAAQGSVDPGAYAANWGGFWIFVGSMAVIVAGWVAARPLVLAPIARLFGTVSGR
ncbi:cytochrome b/b6 domain-containing protein [Microbacterium sp. 18062]|uniref:cytochrome b/b6 domain-containing protein n=1 Tax=Microbacterium sp. 18062 TaxID=2681410 RepID=UPI001F465286|nr:cytochrome b/b6 domain-containing protein [Microbacterium sp. 18062]